MTGSSFTREFKTRSEIMERKMPKINGNNQYKGKTIIALDGGYSAVKGASPNRVFIFPSYAKKTPKDLEIVGKIRPMDIQFRDNKTGETWLVGQAAETLMDQSDLDSTTDASLYTRYRYESDVYRVIMATGMAIGLWGTGVGNEIFLQTGLPAAYKDRDSNKLIKVLSGDYDISIKIGNGDWTTFQFSLDDQHIFVMEQPQGTLCATAYDNGEASPRGMSIMKSNCVILDIGFGTEDLFAFKAGYKNAHYTYSDTGMRAVFDEVIKRIREQYPDANFKIFEFQKYLEEGRAMYFDQDTRSLVQIEFDGLLDQVNKEFCEKSVNRLMQDFGNLLDYKYLIITGGTGESRFAQIQELLKGMTNLTILPGNVNTPDLSFSYSNVMGYYMFRHAKLKAQEKKLMEGKTEA